MADAYNEEFAQHPTDFTILRSASDVFRSHSKWQPLQLSKELSRIRTDAVDADMVEAREAGFVAHHVYRKKLTNESLVLSDLIDLEVTDQATLERVISENSLQRVRTEGPITTVRVTTRTGVNPLKFALRLQEQGLSASVHQFLEAKLHSVLPWHIFPSTGPSQLKLEEAWNKYGKGSKEIVVAVLDDGFDLGHPCFSGTEISPEAKNFVDHSGDVRAHRRRTRREGIEPASYHGTAVASIIFANEPGAAFGIAQNCSFLPIKLSFGGPRATAADDMYDVFEHASANADVICCAFGYNPRTEAHGGLGKDLVGLIKRCLKSGGRSGKGVPIVFSAGNEGVPNSLSAVENSNGVRYLKKGRLESIISDVPISTGYASIPGVFTAAAANATGNRSGFSNVSNISAVLPSSDYHELQRLLPEPYAIEYDSRRILVAQNRSGFGKPISRGVPGIFEEPIDQRSYSLGFGGTSAAAAMLTGILALAKSVNPDMSTERLRSILSESCQGEDNLAMQNRIEDPNMQGIEANFTNKNSKWFGGGVPDVEQLLTLAQD